MSELLMNKYNNLKTLVTSGRKDSFNKFMKYIEENTSYLTSPASTKYHLCEPQGLLKHSISVCTTLLKIKDSLNSKISDEQCVIVGLLHDLGKVGYPGSEQYIKNEPTEKQKKYGYSATPPYVFNESIVHMPHAHRSIYLIGTYGGEFKLTSEECQAILAHDGQFIEDNKSYAHKEEQLTVLLHMADYYSCRFLED